VCRRPNYRICWSLDIIIYGVKNYVSWVHRGVEKEGGGILTMWDNQQFKCNKSVEGKGFILIVGALFGGAMNGVNVVSRMFMPYALVVKSLCCGEI